MKQNPSIAQMYIIIRQMNKYEKEENENLTLTEERQNFFIKNFVDNQSFMKML